MGMVLKKLSTSELTTYLKNAVDLEASAFTQQQVLAHAEKILIANEPVYKPAGRNGPDKPKEPVYKPENQETERKVFKISIIVSIAITAAGILCFVGQWKMGLFIFLEGVLVVTFLMLKRRQIKKELVQIEAENAQQRQAYDQAMEQYHHDLGHLEDVYRKEQEKAQRAYEAEAVRYQAAVDAVDQLRPTLKKTQELLETLYSHDVISEKYRTLAAVSQIYEYVTSGRVTQLEGSGGAYELYESELSQGIITDKMYLIFAQPEDIQEHQPVLYNKVKETKQMIMDIDRDITGMMKAEHGTEGCAESIAECSAEGSTVYSLGHSTAHSVEYSAERDTDRNAEYGTEGSAESSAECSAEGSAECSAEGSTE